MRKLIWCCLAAGVLAAGGFLSLAYYACCCPGSLVGRSMQVIAEASIALQPLSGLLSMSAHAGQANTAAHESSPPSEECIPDEPQPVAPEPKEEEAVAVQKEAECWSPHESESDAVAIAPIVINEDDPMPHEEAAPAVPASLEEAGEMRRQEVPPKGCPIVMPYCRDDEDEAAPPPAMPRAEAGEDSEHTVFKAWMELFEESKEDGKDITPTVEQLPPPTEAVPQTGPKCQEDSHLHEHYPGCPRTTCPYRSKGKEESSEEPPHPRKKPSHDKDMEEECPRTKGVDTMEYRKSDAGLNEYGPGPLH
jgi:hypothetical protein